MGTKWGVRAGEEQRYRQLFENAPIGIVNVALDGTPLMVNERAAHSFGYATSEEFLDEVSSMLDLWVDPIARIAAAEVMLDTGVLRDHEIVMRRRDGTHVVMSVSANPWCGDDGEVKGIQVSGIEVTDRVEAERRLEEAQSQASIGFFSWRLDTNEFWRTPEVYRIFELEPDGVMPPLADLIHDDDRERVAGAIADFKREPGGHFEVEFRLPTSSGITKWLIARGRVNDDGKMVSGSVQDITRQKAIEEKLTELNDLKTEFVGVVAHDLRSPLTVASGYAEFLADQWLTIEDNERRELVGNIQRSLNRLGTLVADVLEITRLEAGVATDIRPFDLVEVVRAAAADLGTIAPGRTCEVLVPAPIPLAMGDRDAIWRVVANLLSNAAKYSPWESPITIRIDRSGDAIRVGVRDHGPGISPADQAKLFQKFSRLTPAGGPRPEGTGLGLFICKSLVESCGGTIWVESMVGAGSNFCFRLHAAPESRPG